MTPIAGCYLLCSYSNSISKRKGKKTQELMKSIEVTWGLECMPSTSLTSKLYHKLHPRQSDLMFNLTGKI